MLILAIDTSSATATTALMENGSLLAEYIQNSGKTHSQRLMLMIDEMLKSCGKKPEDIDLYACAAGPGSFTGLRIGASAVKAMAQVFDKPIAAVPTLDALAYNLYHFEGLVCPMLDAQRGAVYSALYQWKNSKLVQIKDFRVIDAKELIDQLSALDQKVVILGDGVEIAAKHIADNDNISIAPVGHLQPRASSCAAIAQRLQEQGSLESCFSFRPIYIRKSQAEVEYEKKHELITRFMELKDIDAVWEIEKLSFKTPWSRESFVEEIKSSDRTRYVVAELGDSIVGYGGMWLIVDEAHITNIAVHPDYRGQKIGKKIVEAMIAAAKDEGINSLTLEVRISNMPAISLYKGFDFKEVAIRKGYYSDTGEDALIMWKK
ncbi:MAG TPA: tRNA (adenosine(37)-N6)-threonylcarbamoyltransferase complex dimerization subunit type 1 TsaB [Patescibacteria group bacterium]|nr:tRNA (adenosine(37)-N6)-threonylcarbamoyltransferase complex dimerization subunit type 1 TsaB [Patescibacteria group bacterium]